MHEKEKPGIFCQSHICLSRQGHATLQPMVMTTSTAGMSDRSLWRWPSASMSMPSQSLRNLTEAGRGQAPALPWSVQIR